ncbi:MAG: haloacid dehalogenase-like hydrolase, partial [Gaiellaceae bacterium]
MSPVESGRPARLVLDWDGTVTERDTLDLLLEEFGDPEIYHRVEAELGRTLTLNEVIAAEFATVTAPLEEVVPWLLEHARIRPGFAELARTSHPLIVSSGFHETIEPLLERQGVLDDVEVRANRVEARPDGWRVIFRDRHRC